MSRVKCSYVDKYKAMRPPTCGCGICKLKWEVAEMLRQIERNRLRGYPGGD